MSIYIGKERRRNYIEAHAWKAFVIFIVTLDACFGMGAKLGKHASHKKEKEEMACVFLEYFTIKEIKSTAEIPYMLKPNELCKKIHYMKKKHYIDLEDPSMMATLFEQYQHDQIQLQNLLENIGCIRFSNLCIDLFLSFDLAKMFLERIAIKDKLYINKLYVINEQTDAGLDTNAISCLRNAVFAAIGWKIVSTPIELHIVQYTQPHIRALLKWIGARKIKALVIQNSNIKALDLKEIKLAKNCNIVMCGLPDIEKIEFPSGKGKSYGFIEIHGVPKLKKIANMCQLLSSRIKNTLSLDAKSYRVLAKTYKAMANTHEQKTGEVLRKALWTKHLHIDYMPYTFDKLADLSSPWIETENVIICVEYCNSCNMSMKDLFPNYSLKTLKRVGIKCSSSPVYRASRERSKCFEKFKYSGEFIQAIRNIPEKIDKRCFKCPKKSRHHKTLPALEIDLNRSEQIQKAIESFQDRYDMLPVHSNYGELHVYESDRHMYNPNTLEKMFLCMGQIIKLDVLSFCNMKVLVGGDIKKKASLLTESPKTKFVLKELKFYGSAARFIGHMLAKYLYEPGFVIYIDCKKIDEESIQALCLKMAEKHLFSEIILKNAFSTIETVHKKSCSIYKKIEDKLVLSFGEPEYFIKVAHLISCALKKNLTLSSAHIFTLAEDSQTDSKEKRKKNTSYCLVGKKIQTACIELKDFSRRICYITDLGVYICSSDKNPPTIITEVIIFINLLKSIFSGMKKICIFNLKIQKEQGRGLEALNALVGVSDRPSLTHIYLRMCMIFDENCIKISEKSSYNINYLEQHQNNIP
ncbi:hypothetical protein NEFER03_2057 [Nematocida sp. LUAm3]|nr:hypothetical protein NEFER03_2057 [Nematocida sp. LUAm3]KAI5176225.1 hypothetical protein NEFER02_2031 [Nematocida sp. LUAm2]KAI5179213.1 hypothetical protein NEFER01_2070 [Nematocida sp. LUAm1]